MSDTNILSELQKGNRCHADVQRWYATIDSNAVLMIDEIRLSIERLRRRDAFKPWLLAAETLMIGRILSITQAIPERWRHLNLKAAVEH